MTQTSKRRASGYVIKYACNCITIYMVTVPQIWSKAISNSGTYRPHWWYVLDRFSPPNYITYTHEFKKRYTYSPNPVIDAPIIGSCKQDVWRRSWPLIAACSNTTLKDLVVGGFLLYIHNPILKTQPEWELYLQLNWHVSNIFPVSIDACIYSALQTEDKYMFCGRCMFKSVEILVARSIWRRDIQDVLLMVVLVLGPCIVGNLVVFLSGSSISPRWCEPNSFTQELGISLSTYRLPMSYSTYCDLLVVKYRILVLGMSLIGWVVAPIAKGTHWNPHNPQPPRRISSTNVSAILGPRTDTNRLIAPVGLSANTNIPPSDHRSLRWHPISALGTGLYLRCSSSSIMPPLSPPPRQTTL